MQRPFAEVDGLRTCCVLIAMAGLVGCSAQAQDERELAAVSDCAVSPVAPVLRLARLPRRLRHDLPKLMRYEIR